MDAVTTPIRLKVFKAADVTHLEGDSQSKISQAASPESEVVAGVASGGEAAFIGNPDGLACGNSSWTVTTCKTNLAKQRAREDAYEAIFEQNVENAVKEFTEWVIGAKPNKTGYKRVRNFLKDHPEAAEAFLSLLFPNILIPGHDQAIFLDKMFETRNATFHASTFADLDKMMGRAARIVHASPLLRQTIPNACILLDKYYEGGREMVIESNAVAYREVHGEDLH